MSDWPMPGLFPAPMQQPDNPREFVVPETVDGQRVFHTRTIAPLYMRTVATARWHAKKADTAARRKEHRDVERHRRIAGECFVEARRLVTLGDMR